MTLNITFWYFIPAKEDVKRFKEEIFILKFAEIISKRKQMTEMHKSKKPKKEDTRAKLWYPSEATLLHHINLDLYLTEWPP